MVTILAVVAIMLSVISLASKKVKSSEVKWYDEVFGGRKAYKEVWASIIGLIAFGMLTGQARSDNVLYFLGYWLACFGWYVWNNVQEKVKLNGKGCKNGTK